MRPSGLEEQRRAPGLDRPVDDLGGLEIRVDLGVDLDELALPLQQGDPVAQVVEGHGASLPRAMRLPGRACRYSRGACGGGARYFAIPPIAITARKIRPTTSIERTMSRPSTSGGFSAASTQ